MQKPCGILILLFLVGMTVVGCVSDARLQSSTATLLGVKPESITISDRKEQMADTQYVAKTSAGQVYDCVVTGGGITTLGMLPLPACSRRPR